MNGNTLSHKIVSFTAVLAAAGFSGVASAAGFALIEQSTSGLGNAYAGGAAAIDDASVQFFNPAALTEIPGTQISIAGHYIKPRGNISNASATVTLVPLGNISYSGTTDDAGVDGLIPNFYYVSDLSTSLKFGLGITVPFGLSTEYKDSWIGRYHAIKSSVETVNINPALGFKLSDRLSLGAGISAQYIEANLTTAVDSGSLCVALGTACGGPGNPAVDSYVRVRGDDWSYGFNLGLLYKPLDATRVGLAFRSVVKQNIQGDGVFTRSSALNAVLGGSPLLTYSAASADIDLPSNISLSVAHGFTPRIEVMADITWTQWSKFQELRVDFANPIQPDAVTTQNWDDTFRYSLGLSYKLNDRVKLRSGLAFDEAPIPSAEYRTPRIPDNDRTWLAFGLTHMSSNNLSFDLGYAHLFIKDSTIDNTTEGSIRANLKGNYENSVDILSAQLNYKF